MIPVETSLVQIPLIGTDHPLVVDDDVSCPMLIPSGIEPLLENLAGRHNALANPLVQVCEAILDAGPHERGNLLRSVFALDIGDVLVEELPRALVEGFNLAVRVGRHGNLCHLRIQLQTMPNVRFKASHYSKVHVTEVQG